MISHGRNGLGRAIAKAIVDDHGDKIEAGSQPGEGAIFTLHLPKHS
ncbi:MAG TPA: ATP-binding protein [Methylomirabilota bacterium]|nr:ATP-binding protein [Methylomirabilota bacterium]